MRMVTLGKLSDRCMETPDYNYDAYSNARHKSGRRVLQSISESWNRCREFGLRSSGKPVEAVVSSTELKAILQENESVRHLVLPELELLYNQIAGTNFMVAYADSAGVVLDSIQDDDFQAGEGGKAVIPGSIWMESHRGTNALGLALHNRRPAVVSGPDHFFQKLGDLSCFAVPIFNHEEKIVGVIDATSNAKSRNDHTLALVKLASRNIENRLLVEQFSESLILMFHARHEYLPTTSVALIAVDEYGFIESANANAKIMLNGLNLSSKQHFSEVFQVNFSAIVDEFRSHDVIQIKDRMGATVFMKAHPPPMRRIVQINAATGNPSKTQSVDVKQSIEPVEKPFDDEMLKRAMAQSMKSLQMGLPLVIDGDAGSGKSTLAQHILEKTFPDTPCMQIDCSLLNDDNFETYIFGDSGRIGFFDPASPHAIAGKLGLARGGSVFFDNAHLLSKTAQAVIADVIAFEESRRNKETASHILGFAFIGPTGWIEDKNTDLDPSFVDSISGCHLFVPPLNQRTDFQKIAMAVLADISPQHILSPVALGILLNNGWPGQLRQLRKTLQQAVARSETKVIRQEINEVLHLTKRDGITPCDQCMTSPVRSESCIMIKKTWQDTGGNVSLVARRLGVSRNTVYKHVRED